MRKTIIFSIFLLLCTFTSKSQCNLPYKDANSFKTDTVQFLKYNFDLRADCYVGKTVFEILKDLHYPPLWVNKCFRIDKDGIDKIVSIEIYVSHKYKLTDHFSGLKDYYICIDFETPIELTDSVRYGQKSKEPVKFYSPFIAKEVSISYFMKK
jgi:hypothetical protein